MKFHGTRLVLEQQGWNGMDLEQKIHRIQVPWDSM